MARPKTFTDDQILKAIRRFKREAGRVPTMEDLGPMREPGYPSAQTLVNRFGSFGGAIEAAGFPRPTRGRRPVASSGRKAATV